jgi:hypothetical protein
MPSKTWRPRPALCALLTAAGGLWLGAPLEAQEIRIETHRPKDLGRCSTYGWASPPDAAAPLALRQIAEAVDQALQSRGWSKTETAPACLVRCAATLQSVKRIQPLPGGGAATAAVEGLKEGRLTLEIHAGDDALYRVVAHGTPSDHYEGAPGKRAKCVEKMLKPLRAGGSER